MSDKPEQKKQETVRNSFQSSGLLSHISRLVSAATGPVAGSFGQGKRANSIVPERSVASETLMIVVAIMSFLTCLTFATVSIVWQQAAAWQSDISREVTVQVRPVEGIDLSGEVDKAIALVKSTPGITDVSVVDKDWSKRLLEPWLGDDFDLDELPVPQMLVIELDPDRPANLKGLSQRLSASVEGASLDDHRIWIDRLRTMANTTVLVGFGLMALMLTAMILSVTFAAHSAMTGNHEVVAVLHFVGGRDAFIAKEFQRRFMTLGLKGGFVGSSIAILCFLIMNLWARWSAGTPQADQLAALFGRFEVGFIGYFGAVVLVIVIAALTAITSRIAVFRYLTNMS